MRLGLSIAICSVCLLTRVLALDWFTETNNNVYLIGGPGSFTGYYVKPNGSTGPLGPFTAYSTNRLQVLSAGFFSVSGTYYVYATAGSAPNKSWSYNGTNAMQLTNVVASPSPSPSPTPTPSPSPTPTPSPSPTPVPSPSPTPLPQATFQFQQMFPAGMAGKTVSIRDAQGNVLGQWIVPTGGGVISSSVSAASLQGAYWDIDGVVGSIDDPAFNPSTAVENPAYDFNADSSYAGGEFRIDRSDGSIAGSGVFGTSSAVGRVTVASGSSATVWTRVPAGDGNGGTWVPTQVNLSGNGTTSYSFVSNPQPTPAPTPNLPTNAPAPVITNAPSPVPTPGTSSVGPAPVSTNDVSVDVDTVAPIESDGGEQGVLNQVTTMSEKFRQALEKFKGAFENVALTFNEFRKFTLGGVGTNCTLSIGPVNLNLGGIVPPSVRSGMKLFILLVGVFAAIRYTWETFA